MAAYAFGIKKHSIKYTNEPVYSRYKNKVAEKIGRPAWQPFIQNKIYRANYEWLCDPVHRYEYGAACGPGGSDALAGEDAIRFFQRSKDTNAVRSLMQGANPEGRIYAVETLAQMVKLTESDWGIIDKVLKLDTRLNVCEGCSTSKINAMALKNRHLPLYLYR